MVRCNRCGEYMPEEDIIEKHVSRDTFSDEIVYVCPVCGAEESFENVKDDEEENDEAEEEEPPEEIVDGDFVITDKYATSIVTIHGDSHWKYEDGGNDSYQRILNTILEKMDADQFWPNIWHVSDHGNVSMVSVTTEERKAYEEYMGGKK